MGVFLGGLLLTFSSAWGGEVMMEVNKNIDKVISILTDPQYNGPEKKSERKLLTRQVADDLFNWEEMARRTLGAHWRKINSDEKKEFVNLFTDLLERNYLGKIEQYSGEKIIYESEMISGKYALVKTKVLTLTDTEIPLNYRLLRKNDRWKVYDIVIEGVSLVNNYRSQFNSIIRRSSFKDLLDKIQTKPTG
jgi:phospholipid transport system substrate-binding protein